MPSLKEIIDQLTKQAKEQNKIASKILKIKGIKRLVLQLNAVPQDGKIRYSLTLHSANNYKKQIGLVPEDKDDLKLIAEFLEKYYDILNEYVKFTKRNSGSVSEEEIELEAEEEKQQKSEQKQNDKQKKKSVEDEF